MELIGCQFELFELFILLELENNTYVYRAIRASSISINRILPPPLRSSTMTITVTITSTIHIHITINNSNMNIRVPPLTDAPAAVRYDLAAVGAARVTCSRRKQVPNYETPPFMKPPFGSFRY